MSLLDDNLKNLFYSPMDEDKIEVAKNIWEEAGGGLKEVWDSAWYDKPAVPIEFKLIVGDCEPPQKITIQTGRAGLKAFDDVMKEYLVAHGYKDESLIDELITWKKESILSKWEEGWERLDPTQKQKISLQLKRMLSF